MAEEAGARCRILAWSDRLISDLFSVAVCARRRTMDFEKTPKMFDKLGLMIRKTERHLTEDYPLLDALLPILEYNPDQLRAGGFLDKWLTAALRAEAAVNTAEIALKPFGIVREDLMLLLQDRMKERFNGLKAAKKSRKK